MIRADIAGGDALVDRLQSLPERIATRLAMMMESLGAALPDLVRGRMQSSGLETRSGRLARAIKVEAEDASVSVGIDAGAVPYAAIQERGGTTRAHIIETLNARALRFELGGKIVFARRVNHPGSVIPAHSFLRGALADLQPLAASEIAQAVAEGAQA